MIEVPSDIPQLSAMTTQAEREFYYRLAREHGGHGAIVELGAWMGASTAYLAAGLRDSGADKKNRVYVYDRWKWDVVSHEEKHGAPLSESSLYREFKKNLGPLLEYVKPKQGEIGHLSWDGSPVSVLIADAPKRIAEIGHVLRTFAGSMGWGSVMSWQDFAHFPSYQIPACLWRMRNHTRFLAAVTPGTTVALEVTRPWLAEDIHAGRFSLPSWCAEEIAEAWDSWLKVLPQEWHGRFRCGQAMFLHDIGQHDKAVELLCSTASDKPDEVLPKWQYLNRTHKSLTRHYKKLFDALELTAVHA